MANNFNYNFDKARLLAYTHTPVFFENGTRYKIERKLTIEGSCWAGYTMTEKAANTWVTATAIAAQLDYGHIVINGHDFGIGKITAVSFNEGTHVVRQDYTFEIECYDEVVSFEAQPGIPDATSAVLIDKISESVSYEIDIDNNKTYIQTATVRLNQAANGAALDTTQIDAGIAAAVNIIDGMLTDTIGMIQGEADESYGRLFANSGGKMIQTQTYSMVDQTVSFSRRFTAPAGDQGDFSVSYSYDVRYEATGICTVTEKALITGTTITPYQAANSAYNNLFPKTSSATDARTRCQNILSEVQFSNLTLGPNPIQKSTAFDQYKGTIEFTITFSNDPKYLSTAIWTFTSRIEKIEDGDYNVLEEGTIVGLGRPYSTDPLQNKSLIAAKFFKDNVGDGNDNSPVKIRALALYSSSKDQTRTNATLVLTKKVYGQSDAEGIVEYSFAYGDFSNYINQVNASFRKVEIEIQTSMPVALTQTYSIFNSPTKNQIIQTQNQSTVGTRTVTVKLKGKRTLAMSDYIARAQILAAPYNPMSLGTSILKSANYNFAPSSNEFTLNATWNFFGPIHNFLDSSFKIAT